MSSPIVKWPVLLLSAVLVGGGVVAYFAGAGPGDGATAGPGATFVENASCFLCHADERAAWTGSHHDLAMDHATPKTVLGDFDDASFAHHGVTSRFYRRDERFFVETDGPDGTLAEFEIKFVFGYTPLQQYLIELDGGRLQCLQVSWDTENKRWYHTFDEPTPHDGPLHWTGMQFNWNFMCAECHSTNLQRNYDVSSNTYATTWSDIDVGCQACHGPGSEHVAWARAGGKPEDQNKRLAVSLKAAKPEVDHCARCHSRRVHVSDAYRYGEDFLDHYAPALLTEPLYYPDGQIHDEVYVYGSFLQTKKHHRGVRCTDCHDPHSARLKRPGNETCTHCHQPNPPERFPSIARGEYDTPAHHFHLQGAKGSACVDCHMPARTYMGVDPRRDHSFRVPRPDLTEKIGTPNACNGCHDDETPAWAVGEIAKRHTDYVTKRVDVLHFGQVFAAARAGRADAIPGLTLLLGDPDKEAIVRATAAHHLGAARHPESLRALSTALGDPEPLVRGAAAAGIDELVGADGPPELLRRQKAAWLSPLLSDATRWVRTKAARALVDARAQVPQRHASAYASAIEEWLARHRSQADRPGSHLNLGAYHEARRDPAAAESAYLRALALDPGFAPARFNLATLYNGQGRNAQAVRQLREVVERDEENGEAWYSLGLLHAETNDVARSVAALARAAKLLPGSARVARNYALALRKADRLDEAHVAFAKASRLAPDDGELLVAWGMLSIDRRDGAHVRDVASRLRELGPNGVRAAQALLAALDAARD